MKQEGEKITLNLKTEVPKLINLVERGIADDPTWAYSNHDGTATVCYASKEIAEVNTLVLFDNGLLLKG